MTWTCMAANGTGSLGFTDDVPADRRSRIYSEVYNTLLTAQIRPTAAKLMGRVAHYRWILT